MRNHNNRFFLQKKTALLYTCVMWSMLSSNISTMILFCMYDGECKTLCCRNKKKKKFPFFANVLRLNPHSLLPWPCQIMPAKLTKFWQEEIIFTSQYMLYCCPNLHSPYKESIYCFFYLKTLYIFFQSTEYNKFSRNGMKMAFTNILRLRWWTHVCCYLRLGWGGNYSIYLISNI